MSKESFHPNDQISVTPSTLKLNEQRKGKGPGMLTPEEIQLLRQSAKEIQEVLLQARQKTSPKGDITSFVGSLADKTDHVATLEEIESAIADGWAQKGHKSDE
ncbi:hypothetical protein [Methylophilus sp. QUAN]|uniref:hypothetical protein n=1 Tax=Methylophilus sp. QUAN TaxID=2781020 RepID=UPI00188E32BB|nr:hypothetical protein [Methylophilus sp. QUAN]MBF4991817.1 hypothetical protein [Methylophilus sp. QUAN]